MEGKKPFVYVFASGVVVLAAAFIFYMAFFTPVETIAPKTGDVNSFPDTEAGKTGAHGNVFTPPAVGENSKTNGDKDDNSAEEGGLIKKITDLINPVVPLDGVSGVIRQDEIGGKKPQERARRQKTPLTDEEVFAVMWPDDVLKSLEKTQESLIKYGQLGGSDRVELTSQDNVLKFLNKMFDIYAKLANIDEKTQKQYRKSLNIDFVLQLREQEKRVRDGLGVSGGVPARQPFLAGFFDVFGKVANASAIWQTLPNCYKNLSPVGVPGTTLLAFCCNCGLFCATGCVFEPDCGPFSAGCNVPLGCLNMVCDIYPNSIWDKTGLSCGCG